MTQGTLLDLNVLIALAEPGHSLHAAAHRWFNLSRRGQWGVCPLTEAGFVRITTHPAYAPGPRSVALAIAILQAFKGHPDYVFWGLNESWVDLTAPFAARIHGHRQITDAYLLGLAIRQNVVLVTLDRNIRFMAGPAFEKHLLVLE